MNQKEVRELKRRFRPDKNASRIQSFFKCCSNLICKTFLQLRTTSSYFNRTR